MLRAYIDVPFPLLNHFLFTSKMAAWWRGPINSLKHIECKLQNLMNGDECFVLFCLHGIGNEARLLIQEKLDLKSSSQRLMIVGDLDWHISRYQYRVRIEPKQGDLRGQTQFYVSSAANRSEWTGFVTRILGQGDPWPSKCCARNINADMGTLKCTVEATFYTNRAFRWSDLQNFPWKSKSISCFCTGHYGKD